MLDQFYTRPDVAEQCLRWLGEVVDLTTFDCWLEPAAGAGAFYRLMPRSQRIGIDLEPRHPEVAKGDFLAWTSELACHRMIVLGNPPFGKNSSLAVQFFNHAAGMAAVGCIAFILPKTFRKPSVTNRLSLEFQLVGEFEIPSGAFLYEGAIRDIPCVFQIWNRSASLRQPIVSVTTHSDFDFVQDPSLADFAIRRVGVNAGAVCDLPASPTSHYFIRSNTAFVRQRFTALAQAHAWDTVKCNTAGCPSLSKPDIIAVYTANLTEV